MNEGLNMNNLDFDASFSFNSHIGQISIFSKNEKVVAIRVGELPVSATGKSKVLDLAHRQLSRYFSGKRQVLDFAVAFKGTEFQELVWAAIAEIPFGQTATYGQIAASIGNPKAVRAVGGAVGANPLPLRIGCHRVLGSSGKITGYSVGQGIPTKLQLLELEGIRPIKSFERLERLQT